MSELVESRMGAVAWGLWPTPRFPSPLIKPGVPFSGTRLSDWLHRKAHGNKLTARGFGTVSNTQQSPAAPVINGVCRLIANHRDLAIFKSAPEVEALCSAGITRHQRSYCPARLPP